MAMTLDFLLERLDTAIPDQERAVLHDALVFAHKEGWLPDGVYDTAMKWLNVGAYLSAANALVPHTSAGIELISFDRPAAFVHPERQSHDGTCWHAATPSLALASAAIRAQMALRNAPNIAASLSA